MMTIDWSAPSKLLERDDAGSDLHFEFKEIGTGSLASLISKVMALSATARARVIIDAGVVGTFNVGQIVELAARSDFAGGGE
jgi:hypothetical protein